MELLDSQEVDLLVCSCSSSSSFSSFAHLVQDNSVLLEQITAGTEDCKDLAMTEMLERKMVEECREDQAVLEDMEEKRSPPVGNELAKQETHGGEPSLGEKPHW